MTYIFPDTNIFIHRIDFEQIPWSKLVADKEVALVISDVVLEEVDKLKDGPPGKKKDRARRISSKFADYFLRGKKNSQFSVLSATSPSSAFLMEHNLERACQDNVLLGTILNYEHFSESILISGDTNLLVKAQRHNVAFKMMPSEYNLVEEKSETEKELENCRQQLELLTNLYPKLNIVFDNGEDELIFEVPECRNESELLAETLDKIKHEHPYIERPKPVKYDNPVLGKEIARAIESITKLSCCFDPYSLFTDERLAQHNQELDDYYLKCEQFFKIRIAADTLNSQFKELTFTLCNNGMAPSGDMIISFFFPEDVKFYSSESTRKVEVSEPQAPNIYSGNYGIDTSIFKGLYYTPPPSISLWDKDKFLKLKRVDLKGSGLIQHCHRPITIKGGLFIDISQAGDFTIRWRIADSVNPNLTEGQLHIIVNGS